MEKPQISWFVLEDAGEDFEYVPKFVHDVEESYTSGETMKVKIQIWNNRAGNEDIDDAVNARLVAFFKDYEDIHLLNLCQVRIDDGEPEQMVIDIDRAEMPIGTLYGRSNNGSEMNKDNFIEVEMQFGPVPSNIRSELKSLILDVEYDNN